MIARNRMIPIAAIAAVVAIAAAGIGAQAPQEPAVDFTKAALAEVKNAQGQVILSGKFVVSEEDDDDVERKAPLAAAAGTTGASGEAEVEWTRTGTNRRQEVEFSLKGVQAGATYTLIIDGKVFATVTADSRGRAAHERDVPLPAGAGS